MQRFNHQKYSPFTFAPPPFQRQWPDRTLQAAPQWCSVDLRDGNQALIDPMNMQQKLRFFNTLIDCGFKQIETGFPSASSTEYDFHRHLIEHALIPDDVTIQVLVQAREPLIEKTFAALSGVKRAIVHVYNSTSQVQREKVFRKSREDIIAIAVEGAEWLKTYAKRYPETQWIFQYSPESFSQTESDFAIDIVEAVCRVWQPETGQAVIINLPATVEASTPNVFADQVEYFCQNLPSRKHVCISLHTHNDRGCAVAAAELGVLAGADRIEGTLFGNGERTGNMDIVTMAMNLYSQGINPQLNFSNLSSVIHCVTECNQLPLHPRHPYAGELVFTAFSGSHQDAIKKSLEHPASDHWDVAYLPIDPNDIGRTYQDVVRINSQSGKGGVAYVLQRDYGIQLPRWMQIDFSQIVQKSSESTERELSSAAIWTLFQNAYFSATQPLSLLQFDLQRRADQMETIQATVQIKSEPASKPGTNTLLISGSGNGALSAYIDALEQVTGLTLQVSNYAEHALSMGSSAEAIAFVHVSINGHSYTAAAMSHDTVTAMLVAATCAVNAHHPERLPEVLHNNLAPAIGA